MRSRSRQYVLALLGFLLTAAASGDDLCLPRLVFPSLSLGGEALPSDDPNEDFLEATDSELVRGLETCSHAGSGSVDFGSAPPSSSMHTGSCPALIAAAAVTQRPPHTAANVPLRC
jgi:hypothetical protein